MSSIQPRGKVTRWSIHSREEMLSKHRPHTVCYQLLCVFPQNIATLMVQREYGNYISCKEITLHKIIIFSLGFQCNIILSKIAVD